MRGSNSRAIPAPSDVKWRVSGDRAVLVLPDCGDMAFVKIEPGTYLRGSPDSEPGRRETETQHEVTLTQAFWLGTREVTQAQWKSVMHMNPSGNTGDNLPVESVAWSDCEQFFHELDAPGLVKFRFPTEAEWEYACRAGATTAYCFGDDPALLGDYAWYSDNSRGLSQRVGLKKPNAWGLYDMHGNVWEWCQDTLSLYTDGAVRDPIGGGMARARVVRGASFVTADVEDFRCAVRSNDYYTARSATRGFRCATNSSALDDLFAVQEGKKLAPPKGLADLRRDWERAIAEKLSL